MHDNDRIVTRFCSAFERMDADELIEYFTPDALYHNVPLAPLRGRQALYENFRGLRQRFQAVEVQTLRQLAAGELVMNERIDTFHYPQHRIALPIAGVFELAHGRIAAWREYFDLATFKGG